MFQDDLARALWDRKYYESEIEKNSPKQMKRMVADPNDPEKQIEEQYTVDGDGANWSRQRGIDEINKKIARLNEFEGARSQAVNLATEQARRNIAQSLSGVRANANSRGLLYSNYRAGQEQKERAKGASQLGRNVADINNQYESAYDQNQQGLIANQMNDYKSAVNDSLSNYKKALRDYQNRSNTASMIGSAAGTVGGALLSPI